MKGITLAAGKGTRLYPMTKPVCKPLLPVYDKPLLYYPLTVLIQAGIRDILIIVPPGEEESFSSLMGDGSKIGIHIEYKVREAPRGIADAFLVGKEFIEDDSVCLLLGDNIFYNVRNIVLTIFPEFQRKYLKFADSCGQHVEIGIFDSVISTFFIVHILKNFCRKLVSIRREPWSLDTG